MLFDPIFELTHTESDLSLLPIAQQEYCWRQTEQTTNVSSKKVTLVVTHAFSCILRGHYKENPRLDSKIKKTLCVSLVNRSQAAQTLNTINT